AEEADRGGIYPRPGPPLRPGQAPGRRGSGSGVTFAIRSKRVSPSKARFHRLASSRRHGPKIESGYQIRFLSGRAVQRARGDRPTKPWDGSEERRAGEQPRARPRAVTPPGG